MSGEQYGSKEKRNRGGSWSNWWYNRGRFTNLNDFGSDARRKSWRRLL